MTPFDPSKHPRGKAGTATGGQFVPVGQARDSEAAKAQKSKVGKETYAHEIVASPAVRNKRLERLNDSQLQALSREAYSFKSSDPKVVNLRIAIANQLAKRGYDVKDFGALGGGINSNKGVKKSRPKPAAKRKSTAAKKTTSSKTTRSASTRKAAPRRRG